MLRNLKEIIASKIDYRNISRNYWA